jgi:multiple sugar transport system substrate-binding protein
MTLPIGSGSLAISRRHFVALTGLSVLAVPILAACSSSQSTPAAPTTTPASASPAAASSTPVATSAPTAAQPTQAGAIVQPAASVAPSAGKGVTVQVRFNGLSTDSMDFVKNFVKLWNAKGGVQIAPDFTDWASSFQKITTGIAGGIAPDIYGAGGLWTPVMAANGGARAIDDYLKTYKDWSDWYPAAQEDVTWNGKVYGIPYETGLQGNVGYRKSIYDKAGITSPPSTWDEAHQMAKQLVQTSGDTITMAGWDFLVNNSVGTQPYEDAVDQAGGHIFNADKTAPTNNTPECEAALNFLVWFAQNKTMPTNGMPAAQTVRDGWETGKVAQGRVAYTDLQYTNQYAPQVYADTGVAAPLKGVKQAQVLYVDKWMVYSKTKQPDATWEALQGLITPEVLIGIFVNGDWAQPCRKAVENAQLYQQDSRMKVVANNMQYAVPREAVPQSFDVQPAMSREVEAAMRGAKSVKQALQDMDAAVAKIMKGG